MTKRPKQTNCQNEPAYPNHDTELFLFRYPDQFPLHQKIEEINNKDKLIISKPKNSGVCYVHASKATVPAHSERSERARTREGTDISEISLLKDLHLSIIIHILLFETVG